MTPTPFSFRDRTAVITGAAGTLGAEWIRALSARGCRSFVLVDQKGKAVGDAANRLRAASGCAVAALAVDLADPAQVEHVVGAALAADPPASVLINNAGLLCCGPWNLHPIETLIPPLRVNVQAALRLTHGLMPTLLERRGAVVNVASISGLVPTPSAAVYGAGKAFLLSWSEALWAELKARGVRVTATCPGPFRSSLFDGTGVELDPGYDAGVTPAGVVRETLAGLDRGEPTVVPGFRNRAQIALSRALPWWAAIRQMAHVMNRYVLNQVLARVKARAQAARAAASAAPPPPPPDEQSAEVFRGRTALVTGASRGLGEALALSLARRGCRLILTARTRADLERVAAGVSGAGTPPPELIAVDLTDPAGVEELRGAVAAAGRPVDILVNNAGFGAYGRWERTDLGRHMDMVRLNVEACLRLAAAFVPDMVKRGRGGMLNVASLGAFVPMPYGATYGATKAFVLSWTQAVHEELCRTGVRITAMCPGPVPTGFAKTAGVRTQGSWGTQTAEFVAEMGLRAYERNRAFVVPGFMARLISLLPRVLSRAKTADLAAAAIAQRVTLDGRRLGD